MEKIADIIEKKSEARTKCWMTRQKGVETALAFVIITCTIVALMFGAAGAYIWFRPRPAVHATPGVDHCRQFAMIAVDVSLDWNIMLISKCAVYMRSSPFRVIWNIPTETCHEKYGVDLNLSAYGIEVNGRSGWIGDVISLLYAVSLLLLYTVQCISYFLHY